MRAPSPVSRCREMVLYYAREEESAKIGKAVWMTEKYKMIEGTHI